ncbi:MAG: tannase/feruloyl esterase family alpha/beta hydrolase [Pseudomonadota bacterium]|nr:tannase/feruloyl esterase family alpha/beta hydrolase [Pseudomonadota bacterium]
MGFIVERAWANPAKLNVLWFALVGGSLLSPAIIAQTSAAAASRLPAAASPAVESTSPPAASRSPAAAPPPPAAAASPLRAAVSPSPAACDSLTGANLPNGRIASAENVAGGPFTPPEPAGQPPLDLPPFCRVSAILTPTPDSEIRIELWLPRDWNGKFIGVGMGGWGGAINYVGMAPFLRRGYATAATDTGHRGGTAEFALGHPEKLIDFAWRAVHGLAVQSKTLAGRYYAAPPRRAYWTGCSAGGRESLMEAQRYPADFDGILAGAPAADWPGLNSGSLWTSVLNAPKNAPPVLGPDQAQLLHKAALARCDAADGIMDGEIADPRACRVRPASLACSANQTSPACLSPAQVAVATKLYGAVREQRSGKFVWPGLLPGSELGWAAMSRPTPPAVSEFKYVVMQDPEWDPYSFQLDRDHAKEVQSDIISATSPDLAAFKSRGGKLLQYHGWSDPVIAPEASINYYESVVARQGGLAPTRDFYRLFLVPGMAHCNGAYAVDWITALDAWVETGKAPEQIVGERLPSGPVAPAAAAAAVAAAPPALNASLGTKPICAYPQVAVAASSSRPTDPPRYECRAAARGVRPGQKPPA